MAVKVVLVCDYDCVVVYLCTDVLFILYCHCLLDWCYVSLCLLCDLLCVMCAGWRVFIWHYSVWDNCTCPCWSRDLASHQCESLNCCVVYYLVTRWQWFSGRITDWLSTVAALMIDMVVIRCHNRSLCAHCGIICLDITGQLLHMSWV